MKQYVRSMTHSKISLRDDRSRRILDYSSCSGVVNLVCNYTDMDLPGPQLMSRQSIGLVDPTLQKYYTTAELERKPPSCS
jgi:hypothetical protein